MPRRAGKTGKKPPIKGKRYPLNMRTTFEVRRQLEGAAAASGRSLAQEAEFRIDRSFLDQKLMVEALELTYGRTLSGIILAIGETMKQSGEIEGFKATYTLEGAQRWWDNPQVFSQARDAATATLDAYLSAMNSDEFEEIKNGHAASIIEEAASGFTRSSATVERARFLHRVQDPLIANKLRKFCDEEWLKASTHIGDDQ